MNNKVFVPDRLRDAIDKHSWSVTRFCFELGNKLNEPISQSRVYNWIRAENTPDKAMVLVFAKLLDEPIGYFYEKIEDKKNV